MKKNYANGLFTGRHSAIKKIEIFCRRVFSRLHVLNRFNILPMHTVCLTVYLLFGALALQAQTDNGTIKGNVYDDNGKPLALANVVVKGSGTGAITNTDGGFEITDIEPGRYIVEISMVGHEAISQKVTVKPGEELFISVICPESNIELQEVIVSSEKTENLLQKVPITVSAIGSEDMEKQKIVQYSDLLMAAPNFMSMNAGSPTLNLVSTRGILTFSTDPALGVYIDGIPMFAGYGSSVQLMDIERVEILRGPQSTLYGRNALGGIIQVITKKPTNITRGFAEVSLGNYNYQRYGIGLSGPLVKDKLFAGFNMLYDSYKGYFTNEYTGDDFDHPQNYNGNLYLKYLASDRFKLTLNAKAERNDVEGTFPYQLNYETALNNPRTVNQDGTNMELRNFVSTSLLAEYKLDSYTLSSITGYTFREGIYEDYDFDFTPVDMVVYQSPQAQKTLTQEFKIVTDPGKKWQFIGGLFGYYDWIRSPNFYTYNEAYAVVDPNAPYTFGSTNTANLYGLAAYGNFSYDLTQKLKATIGLRFDTEKRDLVTFSQYEKAPDPVVFYPETKLEGNNNALSPKLSLSYQATEDLMLYASYARGFRQGGFNLYSADPDHFSYDPEYTNNYELGAKSEWFNHRLRANMALFYIKWNDQQQSIIEGAGGYVDNVGEMTSKGIEIELTALPAKGLEIAYNFGLADTEYQTLILPDENGEPQNYAGNKQVFTPDYTSTLSLTYNTKLGKDLSMFVAPQWKLLGKQYMNYYNDLVQSSFSLLNLNLGIKYKNYELSLWGKNLADTKYLSFAYATGSAQQTQVLYASPPRTIGITLRARFDSL